MNEEAKAQDHGQELARGWSQLTQDERERHRHERRCIDCGGTLPEWSEGALCVPCATNTAQ